MPKHQREQLKVKELIGHQITFCHLTEEEYAKVYYNRMKSVGWKPIVDSIAAHCILAKNGLFGLKYNDSIITTISASKYPELGIAYIGFYITNEEWRHTGLGRYLWGKVMSLIESEGYTVEFDSPPELVPYYTSLGYKEFSSMTIRTLENRSKLTRLQQSSENIQPIDASNLEAAIRFDQTILPESNRTDFLPLWINKEHTTALAYIEGEVVLGYGVISKHFVDGHDSPYSYIIAPVYAKTPEVGSALIQSLCLSVESDEPIFMDTLDCNSTAVDIANSLGFEAVFPAHRFSATGKLDTRRSEIISQVCAISSHGYAPL